jgi:hypothetical protein
MVKRFVLLTLVILAISAVAYPASANLTPISWGFPVLVQNGSLTALETSMQSASDLESANIAFPTAGLCDGIFGSAFPSIAQNSLQNALATNLLFGQQTQSSYFAYPFLSIGGAPVPGMGLL